MFYKRNIGLFLAAALVISQIGGGAVFAQSAATSITTNLATNIEDASATLNAELQDISEVGVTNVWFEWGVNTSYGSTTPALIVTEDGEFSKDLAGLLANTTYHYRAVLQDRLGISYAQDATFTTGQTATGGTAGLSVSKKVMNLTQNNLVWSGSASARPSDVLAFAITLGAGNATVRNVVIKDLLPTGLIYNGSLLVNAIMDETQNPVSVNGVNVGTIPANEIAIISYQARVATADSMVLGKTTLTNIATITSTDVAGQTVSATVAVENSGITTNPPIYDGPTDYPTGATNNFLTESFLLPLMMIVAGSWFYAKKSDKLIAWIRTKA